ncbi:hypothetical protein H0W26_06060 [Candidatus Dependentiae bacterium]|nr:hypothetical protein [Candidatus Dependentiae bacterium]
MPSIKRVIVILLWCGLVETRDYTDGSNIVEPSHFFVTHPLTVEDIVEHSPELETSFDTLSPEERIQFAECIAALSDAFSAAFLETLGQGDR